MWIRHSFEAVFPESLISTMLHIDVYFLYVRSHCSLVAYLMRHEDYCNNVTVTLEGVISFFSSIRDDKITCCWETTHSTQAILTMGHYPRRSFKRSDKTTTKRFGNTTLCSLRGLSSSLDRLFDRESSRRSTNVYKQRMSRLKIYKALYIQPRIYTGCIPKRRRIRTA